MQDWSIKMLNLWRMNSKYEVSKMSGWVLLQMDGNNNNRS